MRTAGSADPHIAGSALPWNGVHPIRASHGGHVDPAPMFRNGGRTSERNSADRVPPSEGGSRGSESRRSHDAIPHGGGGVVAASTPPGPYRTRRDVPCSFFRRHGLEGRERWTWGSGPSQGSRHSPRPASRPIGIGASTPPGEHPSSASACRERWKQRGSGPHSLSALIRPAPEAGAIQSSVRHQLFDAVSNSKRGTVAER